MNVWLDDKRPMPPGFDVHCVSAKEVIDLIRDGVVDMVSLDHDLGDARIYGTGYDVTREMEWLAAHGAFPPHAITVYLHTANPIGRANMEAAIKSAKRYTNWISYGGSGHWGL